MKEEKDTIEKRIEKLEDRIEALEEGREITITLSGPIMPIVNEVTCRTREGEGSHTRREKPTGNKNLTFTVHEKW